MFEFVGKQCLVSYSCVERISNEWMSHAQLIYQPLPVHARESVDIEQIDETAWNASHSSNTRFLWGRENETIPFEELMWGYVWRTYVSYNLIPRLCRRPLKYNEIRKIFYCLFNVYKLKVNKHSHKMEDDCLKRTWATDLTEPSI